LRRYVAAQLEAGIAKCAAAEAAEKDTGLVIDGRSLSFALEAGPYTRPLFSSTRAVSDTKYTLNTP
jgi:hypothetical protein